MELKVELFPYVGFCSIFIILDLFGCFSLKFFAQVVSELMICGLDEYSLILVLKVFMMEVLGKRVPYISVNNGINEEFVRYSYLKEDVPL